MAEFRAWQAAQGYDNTGGLNVGGLGTGGLNVGGLGTGDMDNV